MPRKARVSSGTGGTGGTYHIAMDRTRSATKGDLWRCRITGFSQPFYGKTPVAACSQAGLFVQSELDLRLQSAAANTGSTIARTRGRKATVRTKTRGRPTMAESAL